MSHLMYYAAANIKKSPNFGIKYFAAKYAN